MKAVHLAVAIVLALSGHVWAVTTVFFDPSQIETLVQSGVNSDTISSDGYLFTYTRDKLFTGGVGMTDPIGRPVRVNWPDGVEAQAITTGPNIGNAQITIRRQDGSVFDLDTLTAKLLANTGGAGGAFEVVPFLHGEEVLPNPIYLNASGSAGNSFTYNTNPSPLGSTAALTGYDAYKISLYVDYAITGLTLIDSSVPEPSSGVLLAVGSALLGFGRRNWRAS